MSERRFRFPSGREWVTQEWVDPYGMRQRPCLPGVYLDDEGAPHINVPELLSMHPDDAAWALDRARERFGEPTEMIFRPGRDAPGSLH